MKVFSHLYEDIISLENLFASWDEFKKGKRTKKDVGYFERHVEDSIFELHQELKDKTYAHASYTAFYVRDPKVRHIHKAKVRDRIVHHAVFRVLNPIFEPTFITDSFSCRKGYGTHKGFKKLVIYSRKVSRNYTRDCWALKCDVRKFYDSIDHAILLTLLGQKIKDPDTLWLVEKIIKSFSSTAPGIGIPIGNLTSQLFANVYLHSFDQFVKQFLKIPYYLRYADDFLLLSPDKKYLEQLLPQLGQFLEYDLQIQLHPEKIFLRKLSWGIDFVGYVALPHYELIRTKTKRRVVRKLKENMQKYSKGQLSSQSLEQSLQSYLGLLSHAHCYRFQCELKNALWLGINS